MAEVILLAAASAFWPLLLAVVLVALRAPHPARILIAFLAGGLLAAMTIGLILIYALSGSSLMSGSSQKTADPLLNVAAGALALLAAVVLKRRYHPPPLSDPETQEVPAAPENPGRLEQALERGTPIAFAAGIVLNIIPSPFAVIAFKDIDELDYAVAGTVAALLAFYVIMFAFIEVPLIGYLIAPGRTAELTARFNVWLAENWRRLAIYALGAIGVYLIVKGVVEFFT